MNLFLLFDFDFFYAFWDEVCYTTYTSNENLESQFQHFNDKQTL